MEVILFFAKSQNDVSHTQHITQIEGGENFIFFFRADANSFPSNIRSYFFTLNESSCGPHRVRRVDRLFIVRCEYLPFSTK